MKVKIGKNTSERKANRLKKKIRIRKTVNGTPERPRLCVFRSGKHMYAQIIDDVAGKTLFSAGSVGMEKKAGIDIATAVGAKIAEIAKGKNIKSVVFDRNGYLYHGRVKSLADGARAAGLEF